MNYFLLDTNVLLWYFWGSKRINPAKSFITSAKADVYISVISLWEVATKVKAGKLTVDINELRLFAKEHAFPELSVTGEHIKAYLNLPNLHKDPFDHMLLAQAITCPMRLITGDSQLAQYSSLVMVV
jgi:PIN domain nuclease of toxin-antitoxin system